MSVAEENFEVESAEDIEASDQRLEETAEFLAEGYPADLNEE